MKETKGNILDFMDRVDAVCITTNGIIKADGEAVMGAGVAKSFKLKYPSLPKTLAFNLKRKGNVTSVLYKPEDTKATILSLPTKHNWKDNSDIKLIETSLQRLVEIADINKYKYIMLVRPGCSNGGLSWNNDVKPLCEKILDDRFYIIS